MAADYNGTMGIDRLKDHYKHCIRLSASNKINPKNAFELQLIDYMQDLVNSTEDGQMNFKIASSALDVGAKIYSNRVDRIQSEAQKVASSILMALDGQQHSFEDDNADANTSANSNDPDRTVDGEEGSHYKEKDKKKISRKKNIKTVVEDESAIDAKLEKTIVGDPFLDGLARDFDMSCPAALICYNALTQPNCLLTIESNNLRKNYTDVTSNKLQDDLSIIAEEETLDHDGDTIMQEEDENMQGEETTETQFKKPAQTTTLSYNRSATHSLVTLVTKNLNCAQIIRNNHNNSICPRLDSFLFNDRSTTISGMNTASEDSKMHNISQQKLHMNKTTGGAHEFNPELYGAQVDDDYGDDHFGGDMDSVVGDGDKPNDHDENDPIPNLDKIAASKPTEYGYSNDHHRLINTWAGPHAWKVFKAPATAKKDAPKSTRKRLKTEKRPIDFQEDIDSSLDKEAEREIRHSADVIRRWKKPLLPQDHNLTDDIIRKTLISTFLRPEDTYHCKRTPTEALRLVDTDHCYTKGDHSRCSDGDSSPAMGGFDDVHDDSDDEFRADPLVNGHEVAIYGAPINNTLTQQAEFEFAGEHLIEQPFEVAQVNIPFAKIAKKMDVRKLKKVMWDLLFPTDKRLEVTALENGNKSKGFANECGDETVIMNGQPVKKNISPTPSELVHLEFSNLYGELPVRVSSKMADDLSQPIAFVTLLHLANEKNLRLIPQQDLKDFIIEQDEML